VVAVPLSVLVPVKQRQSLTVDLDMPCAKVQYTESPERRDDRAADPTAPVKEWRHDPGHRGNVPYRDAAVRAMFGSGTPAANFNPAFRGRCVYVEERLAGTVAAPNGAIVARPMVSWSGRRHGQRKARRWSTAWSSEQIARRLAVDFPNDETMRISHEAIYQALFIQGRGALRRELTACLRTGRALRTPRARVGQRGKGFASSEVMISQRPAEANDRAVPGHWEGDLILGLGSSAIGTLV
jgi:hypothetical protein